jgi:hypothetical protein
MKQHIGTINIEGFNQPRIKATYGELSHEEKLLAQPLTESFKSAIKSALIPIIAEQPSTFPIVDNTSVMIDLYTRKNLNICGVLKNILDSMNKVAYTDDCRISSVMIQMHYADLDVDVIEIHLLTNTEIKFDGGRDDNHSQYTLLQASINAHVVDKYLGYPRTATQTQVVNKNEDQAIKHTLISHWMSLSRKDCCDTVSIQIQTSDHRSDIDNIAVNYLYNLVGIAYESITDLKTLHISINRRFDIGENAIIRFYE